MRFITLLPLMTLVMAGAAQAGQTVYADGTFAPGTVQQVFAVYTTPGNVFRLSQCATCGVGGGPAARIDATFTDTAFNNTNELGLVEPGFTYNPAVSGGITTIDASVDKNFTIISSRLYNNNFRPLIEQGGNFYTTAIAGPQLQGPGTTGFKTIGATGLTAASFAQVDPTNGSFNFSSHPNFAGAPLTFGFMQLLGSSGTPGYQATIVYDNYRLTVNSVPEPATWALLIAGFGGVGVVARRRRTVAV